MKFSLISATSIFALAASWPGYAYVVTLTPGMPNRYDLQRDGATASLPALQANAFNGWEAGFTGPVDRSAAIGRAFPLVPLGAAPGAPPDDDFATPLTGAWRWDAGQKALAIGVARMAPLIGTIDNGNSPDRKPLSTVFIAQRSLTNERENRLRSGAVNFFAPSGTSTATITVSGPANLRRRAEGGFSVATPNNAEPVQAATEPAQTAAEPPAQLYRYAPQTGPGVKGNLVTASFGDAAAASGSAPLTYKPVVPASRQTGIPAGRPNSLPTGEGPAIDARLIDVTLPIPGRANAHWADAPRTFLPASVSANPTASVSRYVTSVLDAAFVNKAAQSVEAFQIGPWMPAAPLSGVTADAVDSLRGKIMAGVGPLDNSLTLP